MYTAHICMGFTQKFCIIYVLGIIKFLVKTALLWSGLGCKVFGKKTASYVCVSLIFRTIASLIITGWCAGSD